MERIYYNTAGVDIVLGVLKAHNIGTFVVTPGSANECFVEQLKKNPASKVYISEDERSAAYMACGLATETSQPVVICCGEATASRNYYPGLTEAFYRQLPLLVITFNQGLERVGQLIPQNINRRTLPKDIVRVSVDIPVITDNRLYRFACLEINKAIIGLKRRGGGPTHINLSLSDDNSSYIKEFSNNDVVSYYNEIDKLPLLPHGEIAVYIGSHKTMTDKETALIDAFCFNNKAFVLCSHASGYQGAFRKAPGSDFHTENNSTNKELRLLIHIGEISCRDILEDYKVREVWRVSIDGECRDAFGCLSSIFEMEEMAFFEYYSNGISMGRLEKKELQDVKSKEDVLDFGYIWIGQQTLPNIPEGSKVHLGVNLLQKWEPIEMLNNVGIFSNLGGYGQDGAISSLVGASLVNPGRLYFGFFEQKTLFYDINVIGNRHVGSNIRLLVFNDRKDTVRYSRRYVENLGYKYLSCSSKEEFLQIRDVFLCNNSNDSPIFIEAFV